VREFQKIGVKVISASGGIDLTAGDESNPTAKLVRQILGAVAEFDRCVITLRTRAARERIRSEKGRCEGRKPYGSRPGEKETLELMREGRQEGATFQQIADRLNSEGIKTRYAGEWFAASVQKILKRSK
jgi:DNA invertase Pin-like site-specific DNA recombinase